MHARLAIISLGLAALPACTRDLPAPRVEPSFLQVDLGDFDPGDVEAPLPFSAEAIEVPVTVQALDRDADPFPVGADLTIDVRPGRLAGDTNIARMTGGSWTGSVSIRDGFGPTRIWFSDLGDRDADGTRSASYATGVTAAIHFALPTLAEMNRDEDHETNQLEGEYAEVRCEDREVRVTWVGADGFWVSDLDEALGSYNSLFVYTFSKAGDEIVAGIRLSRLSGDDQEYLATTQFSFPTYEVVEGDVVAPPEPALLTGAECGKDDVLEGYESAPVRLEAVEVPSDFGSGNADYEDWLLYGQFPVQDEPGGCRYYVSASTAMPGFAPEAGMRFDYVEGMLSEVWGKWIVVVRQPEDLPEARRVTSPPGTGARRLPPRPAEPR